MQDQGLLLYAVSSAAECPWSPLLPAVLDGHAKCKFFLTPPVVRSTDVPRSGLTLDDVARPGREWSTTLTPTPGAMAAAVAPQPRPDVRQRSGFSVGGSARDGGGAVGGRPVARPSQPAALNMDRDDGSGSEPDGQQEALVLMSLKSLPVREFPEGFNEGNDGEDEEEEDDDDDEDDARERDRRRGRHYSLERQEEARSQRPPRLPLRPAVMAAPSPSAYPADVVISPYTGKPKRKYTKRATRGAWSRISFQSVCVRERPCVAVPHPFCATPDRAPAAQRVHAPGLYAYVLISCARCGLARQRRRRRLLWPAALPASASSCRLQGVTATAQVHAATTASRGCGTSRLRATTAQWTHKWCRYCPNGSPARQRVRVAGWRRLRCVCCFLTAQRSGSVREHRRRRDVAAPAPRHRHVCLDATIKLLLLPHVWWRLCLCLLCAVWPWGEQVLKELRDRPRSGPADLSVPRNFLAFVELLGSSSQMGGDDPFGVIRLLQKRGIPRKVRVHRAAATAMGALTSKENLVALHATTDILVSAGPTLAPHTVEPRVSVMDRVCMTAAGGVEEACRHDRRDVGHGHWQRRVRC